MENKLLLQDIAEAIATKGGLSKKNSEAFVKALFETIEQGLTEDKFVKIKGFGTFKVIAVGERESVNINTGERFFISGHDKITFTPDNSLKDLVNRPFAHFQTVILNDETDINELDKVDELIINSPEENAENKLSKVDDAIDKEKYNDNGETSTPSSIKSLNDEVPQSEISTSSDSISPSDENIKDNAGETNKSENIGPNVAQENSEVLDSESESSSEEQIATFCNTSNSENPNSCETQDLAHQSASETNKEEDLNLNLNNPTQETAFSEEQLEDSNNKEKENIIEDAQNGMETDFEGPIGPCNSQKEEHNGLANSNNDVPQSNASDNKKEREETEGKNSRTKYEKVYITNETDKKKNIWKNVTFCLFAILILLITYFAGYFKIFCPCEFLHKNITSEPIPLIPPISEDSIFTETDSILKDTTNAVNDSISLEETVENNKVETLQTTIITSGKPQETLPLNNQKDKESTINDIKTSFKQVEGGKYIIIGTLRTHKIERGETIRTIAQEVYGSKGYAVYIITHNELVNPNLIDTGTVIKLPKLKLK